MLCESGRDEHDPFVFKGYTGHGSCRALYNRTPMEKHEIRS